MLGVAVGICQRRHVADLLGGLDIALAILDVRKAAGGVDDGVLFDTLGADGSA